MPQLVASAARPVVLVDPGYHQAGAAYARSDDGLVDPIEGWIADPAGHEGIPLLCHLRWRRASFQITDDVADLCVKLR